jgi:ferric-dicitrate binding protein FerR (iron transport regulator)
MELTNYYIKIAKLIALEVTGDLSPDEEKVLGQWLGTSSENKKLYQKIHSEVVHLLESQAKINFRKDIAWERISKETVYAKKPVSINPFFKYAAAILLIAGISGLIYINIPKKTENTIAKSFTNSEFKPGFRRALLVKSDGSNIELSQESRDTIREGNGTVIENGENILAYNGPDMAGRSKKKIEKTIYNTLITPKGGEYNLILSDGTKIWVNAGSKLRYPVTFTGNVREIELEGEAYFEVKEQQHKPFVIKTKQYDVEVLGTVFNILAYPDDKHVMTTLIEGSVRVTDFDDSGNEVFLKPQEQLILDKTEKGIFIRKVDAGNYTAWKNGRFVFISQNLEDILKTLSRWYNFDVEFESDELKKIVFTGNIDKYEELSTLLEMITKTNKVNFKIEDKKVLATTRK